MKNPAIWLTKSILDHISGTRIFPNMKFVYACSNYSNINFHYRPNGEKIKELRKKLNFPINLKNPRLGLFSHFWGKTLFSRNLPLSCTTPQGPLTPCSVPEKTKEPIPRKLQNRRTDRPYWNEPSGHGQGSNRRISQLRATAVDNKNKIKYSSS